MSAPSLESWNHQVLMLVQALLGAVSPNFRMVTLGHDGHRWQIRFYLQEDRAEDREEIADILSEFDAFQSQGVEYGTEVQVTAVELPQPLATERMVYRRREL